MMTADELVLQIQVISGAEIERHRRRTARRRVMRERAEATLPSLKVLSLGAGVQSTTVLLMSCVGELPRLDAAIFADTQWEPAAVYEHLKWLEVVAARHGIPVHRVTIGNIREDALGSVDGGRANGRKQFATMPLFVRQPDGTRRIGMGHRQCTKEYKIEPVERHIRRALCGLPPYRVPPLGYVEHWFGISTDEVVRAKPSRVLWKNHRFPLLDCRMSRADCLSWLEKRGFSRPPRSACIGCPMHSNEEWRALKERPAEWADACAFDAGMRRKRGVKGEVFVHRSAVPLVQVDLSVQRDGLTWGEECSGYCGT